MKGKEKMNCESCKNKQASVFFADESGGRHALCGACAQALGKISPYSPSSESGQAKVFIPEPTLSALIGSVQAMLSALSSLLHFCVQSFIIHFISKINTWEEKENSPQT